MAMTRSRALRLFRAGARNRNFPPAPVGDDIAAGDAGRSFVKVPLRAALVSRPLCAMPLTRLAGSPLATLSP
ncbi:MAG: hypothetical protein WD073_09880, partial [Xanthobacteraceae bacterium]